uniref:Kinesin motor domain-containing protein n=1 Tax=Chromera velia CCMP2878 TaxID=1169474 RepID=A0A0G4ICS9_9ALVE|eukprot:Cvel_13207.t1-p1 / transcript=Cvel_13207.t1 / gene=Cvel_13207 / organism=Chromera_velia_CCMP2878 / gene_product=Bipolar kinesin KRP-130, putative / transcript_product=Bipolar kinesin KRP-130, putative / location=Cvel_scaffold894:641-7157(+) / protein_length=1118 / sequence_SO=supercontig / SO=protein_coding / is_pseudo=false
MTDGSARFRVAARIRPFQPHDGDGRKAAVWVTAPDSVSVRLEEKEKDGEKRLSFDQVFGPEASQHDVFARCALPQVEAVLDGVHACVFAFGQTGAGKTFTMIGPEGGRRRHSTDEGILPRASGELFRRIARMEGEAQQQMGVSGSSEFRVRVSFLEVFKEKIFDLLALGRKIQGSLVSSRERETTPSLALREKTDGSVYAEGAVEERVRSTEELLKAVEMGASARATAATGVHARSSRSHALLQLVVEHRWRQQQQQQKDSSTQSVSVKSRVARLTLVDLAGSETMERAHAGRKDEAGTATNMGLLVLSRVIRALAEVSEAKAKGTSGDALPRVPFRDSALTRLLQSSLDGRAAAQMIVCVPPGASDPVSGTAPESLRSLEYASKARRVKVTAARGEFGDAEADTEDPLRGDQRDPQAEFDRRCLWLETKTFGDVFARAIGDSDRPLVLLVHGSGPRNSSMFWNVFTESVARLNSASATDSQDDSTGGFYFVSIDCPGYGRSPGDRQTIRSYPGQLIKEIVTALGRRAATALVGSSQGACAVFNAVLEVPSICAAVAVVHPVGHAVQRYKAIKQPTLLIFDCDDLGHPVTVGRLMRQHLPRAIYFEYSSSNDGGWAERHGPSEFLKLLRITRTETLSQQSEGGPGVPRIVPGERDSRMPELSRLAGGLNGYSQRHNGEISPWDFHGDSVPSHEAEGGDERDGEGGPADWRAELDVSTNAVVYVHVASGRRVKRRPVGVRVDVCGIGGVVTSRPSPGSLGMPEGTGEGQVVSSLFGEEGEDSDSEEAQARQRRKKKEEEREKEREETQTHCDRCMKVLVAPVRLRVCGCALCGACLLTSVPFTGQCPSCQSSAQGQSWASVSSSDKELPSVAERETAIEMRRRLEEGKRNETEEEERKRGEQESLLSALRVSLSSSVVVVVEFGNDFSALPGGGGKTNYRTFVRFLKTEPSNAVSQLQTKAVINKATFNINPGFSKPTATVQGKDAGKGGTEFSFEYAMARPFPCYVTLFWKDSLLPLPPVELQYVVQQAEGLGKEEKNPGTFRKRLLIQVPRCVFRRGGEGGREGNGGQRHEGGAPAVRRIPKNPIIVDAETPVSVWVRFREDITMKPSMEKLVKVAL